MRITARTSDDRLLARPVEFQLVRLWMLAFFALIVIESCTCRISALLERVFQTRCKTRILQKSLFWQLELRSVEGLRLLAKVFRVKVKRACDLVGLSAHNFQVLVKSEVLLAVVDCNSLAEDHVKRLHSSPL